jgi:hypothetical protein
MKILTIRIGAVDPPGQRLESEISLDTIDCSITLEFLVIYFITITFENCRIKKPSAKVKI